MTDSPSVQAGFAPLAALHDCSRGDANACLTAWGHADGPIRRPLYGPSEWCHVLVHEGEPIAVAVASKLIAPAIGGWPQLHRDNTVELSRLCAARRDLNRVMLRLWRELVFPALPFPHAISYQHATRNTGDLYRFDGWTAIGTSSSGSDARSGRRGYRKRIWGWALPAGVRAELDARRVATPSDRSVGI